MFSLDVFSDPHFERTIRLLQAFLIHMNYVQKSVLIYVIYPEISIASFPKKTAVGPTLMEMGGG